MNTPSDFRKTRAEALHRQNRDVPFATVPERLYVNHQPSELCGGVLQGHVAGGNELAERTTRQEAARR